MAKILQINGRPYESSGSSNGLPRLHRAPPVQIPGRFKKKGDFESVATLHRSGYFQMSSWVAEQMMTASPVASAVQTRCDKLTGTPWQFAPGKNNDKGRRAARDAEEDWKLIAPPTARAQLHTWGLFQGAGFAQKHWYISPTSGRAIPKVEPFHPMWTSWDWGLYAYRCWTWSGGYRVVPSPSLSVPGEPWKPANLGSTTYQADDPRLWIVYEPYGPHSWRQSLCFVLSLWEDYFGWALANNDMNRVCEKQGRGQMKLKGPKVSDADRDSQDEYIDELLDTGAEGIFFLEQYGLDDERKTQGYELEPFAWPATGFDIVSGTKNSNAATIAGRILGHNTQASTEGADGAGGGAKAGSQVREDIAIADLGREFTWAYPVLRDWAEVNYGDPDCAPIPVPSITDPRANVAAAQTAQFLAVALPMLQRAGVDVVEFLRTFSFPLVEGAEELAPLPLPTKGADPGAPAKEQRGDAAP